MQYLSKHNLHSDWNLFDFQNSWYG